jgi:hypothetical protein
MFQGIKTSLMVLTIIMFSVTVTTNSTLYIASAQEEQYGDLRA